MVMSCIHVSICRQQQNPSDCVTCLVPSPGPTARRCMSPTSSPIYETKVSKDNMRSFEQRCTYRSRVNWDIITTRSSPKVYYQPGELDTRLFSECTHIGGSSATFRLCDDGPQYSSDRL